MFGGEGGSPGSLSKNASQPLRTNERLPQRPRAHELEVQSEIFFRQNLPAGWTCDKPQHDYCVDLRIGLATDGQITGQQLVVQLKASEVANAADYVVVSLEVTTLALLRQMLEIHQATCERRHHPPRHAMRIGRGLIRIFGSGLNIQTSF
jgi:hypothetical protein